MAVAKNRFDELSLPERAEGDALLVDERFVDA